MTVRSPDRSVSAAQPLPQVFADLRMEVDGQRVHLVGDGRSLVLHVAEPLHMVSVVRRTSLPAAAAGSSALRGLGRAADALRTAELRIDVRGPEGVLLLRLGERRHRPGPAGHRQRRRPIRVGSRIFGTVTATFPIGRSRRIAGRHGDHRRCGPDPAGQEAGRQVAQPVSHQPGPQIRGDCWAATSVAAPAQPRRSRRMCGDERKRCGIRCAP